METRVYLMDTSDIDLQGLDLKKLISPERYQALSRYRFLDDKKRSYASERLLRYILKRDYGQSLDCLGLTREQGGKPKFLTGDLHFNLSHSGKWVALVVSSFPVGIDVEEISSFAYEDLLEDYFTPGESGYILKSSSPLRAFYNHWSVKESIMKLDGRGLSLPAKSIDLNMETLEKGTSLDGRLIYSFVYKLDGYALSLSAYTRELPVSYHIIKSNEIG